MTNSSTSYEVAKFAVSEITQIRAYLDISAGAGTIHTGLAEATERKGYWKNVFIIIPIEDMAG